MDVFEGEESVELSRVEWVIIVVALSIAVIATVLSIAQGWT